VSAETWNYTSWQSGEPNDAPNYGENNEENYLQFFNRDNSGGNPLPGSNWNDVNGDGSVKGYIIEWNTNPVPVPGALLLFGTGLLGLGAYGLRRRPRS